MDRAAGEAAHRYTIRTATGLMRTTHAGRGSRPVMVPSAGANALTLQLPAPSVATHRLVSPPPDTGVEDLD